MESKLISIADIKEKKRKELEQKAFYWAFSEQKRLGCISELLSLRFEKDNLDHDKEPCILSIFLDSETGLALLRRDWLDTMTVKYDLITNFPEIQHVAPRSTEHLLSNGIKLYRFYDGPSGGVTCWTDKKWEYS